MQAEPGSILPSGSGEISRRTLLKSGASALATAYSLNAIPAWAARGRIARIDEAAIRRLFEHTAKSPIVPGAFMILRGPGVEVSAAYGSGVLGGHRRVGPHDHFRIGSVTKTFTGTAILQAAQRGDLRLDHPVSRYRPDVPNGKHITIAAAGDAQRPVQLHPVAAAEPDHGPRPKARVQREEAAEHRVQARPNPDPGKEFEYSNTNTVLLGLIAKQVFGQQLARIFEDRLFRPLGMRRTSMPARTSVAIPRPHPRGYMFGTNVSTLETEKLPARQLAAAEAGRLKPNDVTLMNPSWAGAAGAGISTAEDLARWAKAICDGSLLNRRWRRRRLDSIRSIDPTDPNAPGHGLAIAKFGAVYGHTGELPGFQTFTAYDPVRRLTLVVWTNLNASPRGLACAATIAQQLIGKLYA